ncbi:beta strand repeat-containing protein [Sediminicola luteus]|uniref:Uncharacterized protein n=1 Tax=Sediminicola luteus TaxID=319238 RepID=A0A2A4G4T3_9FLAO|nr:hypothetical protein [Sediminicola luteus]PCE63441.1 hypothetical protein B7P33_14610 [Sediminicola luteus]
MKKRLTLVLMVVLSAQLALGQIKIGDNPQDLHPASVLELESTERAFVIPRLNEVQMQAIHPLAGAMVYNIDSSCVYYYNGSSWLNLCNASARLGEAEVDAMVANNGYLTTEVDGSTTNEIQTLSLSGNELSLSRSGGSITLPTGSADGVITNVALSGTSLNFTGSNNGFNASVELSSLDTQLNEAQVDNFVANNGYLITEVDGSTTNEIQTLSLSGNELSLSRSGGSITLPTGSADGVITNVALSGSSLNFTGSNNGFNASVDLSSLNTQLNEAQVDNFVANNGYLTTEVDGSTTNEIQTLSLSGNELSLSRSGGSITLPTGSADGVITNVALSGSSLNFTGSNNGFNASVDLSSLDTQLSETQVDAFVNNNGFLTVELDDDPTNELELPSDTTASAGDVLVTDGAGNYTWATLTGGGTGLDTNDYITGGNLNGQNLELTGGGAAGATIDLSGLDTQLSEAQVDSFANNNGYLTTEVDGSTTNEIQTLSLSGNELSLSHSGGSITLPTGSADGVISNVALSGTSLNFTGSNNGFNASVDLSSLNTQLSEAQVDNFVANNGYLTTEVDGSTTNEIQTLSLSGNELSLSSGGGSITLPTGSADGVITNVALSGSSLNFTGSNNGFNASVELSSLDTQLNEVQVDNFVANNGYLTTEVDGSTTNEIQTLSLSGNELSLSSGGGSITLPSGGADGVITNVALSGTSLNFTGSNNGFNASVDLSSLDTQLNEAQVDNFVANNGYLITEVDGSTTNEIQTLSLSGNELSLSSGGGSITLPSGGADGVITNVALSGTSLNFTGSNNGFNASVDLSSLNTQLSEAQVDNFVANNGYLITEVDGSTTNEIQTLSLSGNELSLSRSGGTITLPTGSADGVITNVTLNGTSLNFTGSNNGFNASVDLSGLDTQLNESQVDNFVANNGYLTTEVDGSTTNEIQTLSLSGNELSLSSGGGSITLPSGDADGVITNVALSGSSLNFTGSNNGFNASVDLSSLDTQLNEAQVDNFVANNGYLITEVDGSTTNEIQTLSLSGNELSLSSGGGSITLPSGGADGVITNVALSGSSLNFTGSNNGFNASVDLSSLDTQLNEAQVDNFVANNGYLTTEVDGSTTNEIQTLSLSGNELSLSKGGGTISLPSGNMATTDLTFTDVRRHNLNGFDMFLNGGNIAIGTTSMEPGNTLEVNGRTRSNDYQASSGSAVNPSFHFGSNGGGREGLYQPETDGLGIVTAGTEAIRIDPYQKVGINEPNPTSVMDLGGSVAFPVRIVRGAVTLDQNDHTLIYNGPTTISLPNPATCPGREYRIVSRQYPIQFDKQVQSLRSPIHTYNANTPITNLGSMTLISDGNNWYEIALTP